MPISKSKTEINPTFKANTADLKAGRLFIACRVLGVPSDALLDQLARVYEMFRPEVPARPAAILLELDAEEVADFAKYAVTNRSQQLTIPVPHDDANSCGNWLFDVKADA